MRPARLRARTWIARCALLLVCAWLAAAAPEEKRTVRIATLAPRNSSYHKTLLAMGESWGKAPDGGIKTTIYPDGSLGGEADLVRRMRVGGLQGAMLTVTGLSEIDPAFKALQNLPMTFRSLEEAAYVRSKLAPDIEKRLAERGFVLLFLGDVGWVKFFSKTPIERPDDLKRVKLFTWAGNTEDTDLMKSLGLQPVPLEPTDALTGLQTGLIDAIPSVPFFALAAQFYGPAKHMLDIEWAPLVGGGVLTKKAWDTFTPAQREAVLAAARKAGEDINARNKVENDQSVDAMKQRGLVVHAMTPELREEWRAWVEPVLPRMRGKSIPADFFDLVFASLKEYRASDPAGKPRAGAK